MASSSSSNNMAPPRANGSSYDVFLSFRGEDTRQMFTDHLYVALEQAGICTFRDSDDAERGEELKQEIERAIKSSDASIIVLSENYASSTWCLDELSLILDQRRDRNHFVLPLFYNVDPSDIGKHRGTFKIAANPSGRWTYENVNKWKSALTEVVGVIGMRLFGSEAKFIKEVVNTIYNRLERKQIHIPPNVTGIDARYKEIFNSWLKQSKDEFLVIYGMPGSGKSTLAEYIVYSYGQHYESYSIVEKIGSRRKNGIEMVVLQQQLCSDISKGRDRSIHSVCQGTAQIEVLLEKTKALIVLDDVAKESQLEDLLGSGNINKESKIIITTDNDLSNWFISKSKRYHEYKMKLLNDDESLELFSLHAFRSKIPKDGYKDLAQKVVRYCEGNPLALEVLGSSLSKKNTRAAWKSELNSFGKDFHGDIDVVLKRSFYSLTYFEKELFLHIACFFVGEDMNYVVNILEPDYAAESKIKTLTKRCFLYVTPGKKLMMHRLLQEMGRSLVDRESRILAERSRVWRNKDSYEMLRRKKSSMTIEGLALDVKLLREEEGFETRKLHELSSYSLQQMDRLKLLKLSYVELTGSYEDLSEHLRWLCWVGFSKSTIHTDLFMGKLVALDMSNSCLKEFEPPMVLGSLKILNLKDSHNLLEIRSIDQIPNLETLILWNCHSLFRVCRNIGNLERLSLLNMTGCKKLCKMEQVYTSVELNASTSGGGNTQEPSFPLPHLLQRLFLDDCNLECTDYFPLSFNDQISLQYINLGNGLFEVLPSYNCLKNLRVLDLRNCSRLKRLLCLPTTLAELYINYCMSIEKITFESGRFTLQEFGYEGCFNLCEIEGLIKLFLVAKLDETDLGHMIWVKEYQNYEVCLVGDYELTKGRSCYLQMLYEFNIMSTSLPDIKHPNLVPEYTSQSTSVSFDVPCCSISSSLRGLNVILRYKISGDDWAWFAKISMTNGDDLIYNPKVFGRPASGEACIWLSYWPIGNLLDVGDEVTVSIVVMSGLEVLECGASLVYTDDDIARETFESKLAWVETVGRDLSGFQLSKGSYYLCRRDFYKLMEVGRLTPGWLHSLVGDPIDDTEVRGWRMAGQPRQIYQSFTELKTVRCIIHCPETIAENSSSSFADKTVGFTSSILGETVRSGTASEFSNAEIIEAMDMSEASVTSETLEYTTSLVEDKTEPAATSLFSKLKTKFLKLKDVAFTRSKKNVSELYVTTSLSSTTRFSLKEILSATNNFDNERVIGRGGSWKVYIGQIRIEKTDGLDVAIKRFDPISNLGEVDEFRTEIEMLSKLRHRHLVSLIGYCDDKERVVVYEYMPSGTLYDHLHKTETPLSWMQRMRVAIGVGIGLDYLHSSTQQGIIHRDVKSSNILLDKNLEAKVSGLGFSIIGDQFSPIEDIVVGTPGYLDPQSYITGEVTEKSDVFSFGVLLFELLSGRFAIDYRYREEHISLVTWAKECVEAKKLDQLVDSKISGTIAPECLRQFAQLADCCVHSVSSERPTMTRVVYSLHASLELQEEYLSQGSKVSFLNERKPSVEFVGEQAGPFKPR